MTNGEKYKTIKERTEAFDAFCDSQPKCEGCPLTKACDDGSQTFAWLELEADEEPLPCPFCEHDCSAHKNTDGSIVACEHCGYISMSFDDIDEAIAAHNRVARAVMASKEKEAK